MKNNRIIDDQAKISVLCVIPSMVGGGAEKVMLTLLENFDRTKFTPILVLFNAMGENIHLIPSDIELIDLKKQKSSDVFLLIYRLASIIKLRKPDVILSHLVYANFIAILAGKISGFQVPVVIVKHSFMSIELQTERFSWMKRLLARIVLPWANTIVTVSEMARNDLIKTFGMPASKIIAIPNAFDAIKVKALSLDEAFSHDWFSGKLPVVVTIGRLTKGKGFSDLLKAFAMLLKYRRARLIILGEGEERNVLQELITHLELGDTVHMPGFVSNPYPYLKNADVFVMSSYFEGFPGALMEALACGVPVISTDCPSGPSEIITNQVDGLLVPVGDVSALCSAMNHVLDDHEFAKNLAAHGKLIPEKRYSLSVFMKRYEDVLYSSIADRQFD
jgi:glycosyltransferase involved in cell wall biosynthesis